MEPSRVGARLASSRVVGRLAVLAALILLLVATTIGPLSSSVRAAPPSLAGSRPDIIVLMLDDMNADAMPRVLERLPALKATFVDQGIRFPNAFAQDPLCCPARVGFLTGQTAAHHHVYDNDARLFDPSVTVATALHDAGYHTIIAGKYLNRLEMIEDKTPPGWDQVDIMSAGYQRFVEWRNDRSIYRGTSALGYSTDVFARRSVAWLRDAPQDKPRFVFLTPYAPHGDPAVGSRFPSVAPRHLGAAACAGIGFRKTPAFDEPQADRADRAPWVRRLHGFATFPEYDARGWPLKRTCQSLLAVDEWFASIVEVQRSQGRLDRTLFVLIGDNGMSWGDHGYFAKSVSWATPVPLYLSWPAELGGLPSRNPAFVMNIDLAPTFAALAGTTIGPYPSGQQAPDGRSVLGPIEAGGLAGLRRTGLFEEHHDLSSPRLDWVALRTTSAHPCGLWHLTRWADGFIELFDLTADPWELTNVAAAQPAIRAQLVRELTAIRRGSGKPATTCAAG